MKQIFFKNRYEEAVTTMVDMLRKVEKDTPGQGIKDLEEIAKDSGMRHDLFCSIKKAILNPQAEIKFSYKNKKPC